MDLELWKQTKKEKRLTLQDISDLSGIPKRTVDAIFVGKTPNPRIDTVEAIEKALGINQEPKVTSAQSELFELINSMNEEELAELNQIVDYVISKRK